MTRKQRLQYHKNWYKNNRTHCLAYFKNQYKKNHEYWLEKGRQYCRTLEGRFRTVRRLAQGRGLKTTITLLQYSKIIAKNRCYYCKGTLPVAGAGLDRIDSSKGYTLSNVRSCCEICNKAKNDLPEKEFRAWARRLYRNWASK
jgi:hypothetical protein